MELNKSSNSLETPVQYLKGVGPRRSKAFESVEIVTLKDLLYYFPRKYLDKFLKSADISEQEFHDICDKFTNKEIFLTNEDGSIKKDDEKNPILKNPLE